MKILNTVLAQTYGLDETAGAAGLSVTNDLPSLIGKYLNGVFGILGIIFIILVIYGGFKILLSQGNDTSIKTGRNTILYALIGIIIITLSFALTTFVFTQFINPTTTATTTQ